MALLKIGSLQFVQDAFGGESLRDHGQSAAFTSWLFKCVWETDCDEEHCALHAIDAKMVNVVTVEEDNETQQEVCKVSRFGADKQAQILSYLQIEKDFKVPKVARFSWASSRGSGHVRGSVMCPSRSGSVSHGSSSTRWGGTSDVICCVGRLAANAI